MKFKIPLATSNIEKLKARSKFFIKRFRHKKESSLGKHLEDIGINLTREQYLGIVLRTFTNVFLSTFVIFTVVLAILGIKFFYVIGFLLAILFGIFNSSSQLVYPKVFLSKKQREIEKNLVFALEDMSIQLNSGIPLFDIMTNISTSNYGELSLEFKKAVKRIGSGEPDSEVLSDIGKKNPSVFFRRTLWQISNGLDAGSDMAAIIKESIKTLNEEQIIQIQNYGNKLNPLIMMYMLISVIIPALSVSFMTVVASMMGLERNLTTGMFVGLFVFVLFFQIMFLGLIKSKRPSLL